MAAGLQSYFGQQLRGELVAHFAGLMAVQRIPMAVLEGDEADEALLHLLREIRLQPLCMKTAVLHYY